MLNRIFGKYFHDYLHVFALICFGIGLSTSKIILSLSSILLLLNLVLEADFRSYWRNLKHNKLFFWVAAFFGLHLLALIWTEEISFAFSDIRIKLTLLLIPLILTCKPITKHRELNLILIFFTSGVFITSLINFLSYNHLIGNIRYDDIRGMSLFGSHIRYGILVALAGGTIIYFMSSIQKPNKWYLLLPLGWFIYYSYYSQIISGILSMAIVLLTIIVYYGFKRSKKAGYTLLFTSLVLMFSPLLLLIPLKVEKSKLDYVHLEEFTKQGNRYDHYFAEGTYISGRPVFGYISDQELGEAWKKRSKMPYHGNDLKGQKLRFTLFRYMTSKDLKKDAEGLAKLSDDEIDYIEKGIADVNETKTGLVARIEGIQFQIQNPTNPNGHSLLQRLEYWKTATNIIKKNWLFGVGTGDLQVAFDHQYEKDNSALKKEFRHRAHNSYLTAWISFGILGLLVFIGMLISYFKMNVGNKEFVPIMFILVAAFTFIIEDTLETQLGVSLFAFFYGLYMNKSVKVESEPGLA